jgi:ATP-dependent helicase IRC3
MARTATLDLSLADALPGEILFLRPYQREAVDRIFADWSAGRRRLLLTLPTGTGKTVVFCEIIRRLLAEGGGPVLIVAHREELLMQAREKLLRVAPHLRVELERGDLCADPRSDVVIASVQTLGRSGSKRLRWLRPELVIVDEAHHILARSYLRVLERFEVAHGNTLLLGCTATPERLDGQELGRVFEREAYRMTLRQAIEEGWLCPITCYRVTTKTDLSRVHVHAGDFSPGELEQAVNVELRTESVIARWQEVAGDRRTIAFCVGVEHARDVARSFRAAGFAAAAVDGGMDAATRADVIDRFRAGTLQVVTCCEILTEGFDCPEVSAIVMMRPTKSKGLYAQMAGRGTRLAPGKSDLIIIDVVDNHARNSLRLAPEIIGLPGDIDLEGRSLLEAARTVERLAAADESIRERGVRAISEAECVLARIELFGTDPEENDRIREQCRFAWVKVAGGYLLPCGGPEIVLKCGPEGNTAHLIENGRQVRKVDLPGDEAAALRLAEMLVRRHWPKRLSLVQTAADWRQGPPTDRQAELMLKLGYSRAAVAAATKGLASDLISRALFEQRAEDRRQRREQTVG